MDGYLLRLDALSSAQTSVRLTAPESNGVAERIIRTLKEQVLWVRTFQADKDHRLAPHN